MSVSKTELERGMELQMQIECPGDGTARPHTFYIPNTPVKEKPLAAIGLPATEPLFPVHACTDHPQAPTRIVGYSNL